jgi:cell division cycle 14
MSFNSSMDSYTSVYRDIFFFTECNVKVFDEHFVLDTLPSNPVDSPLPRKDLAVVEPSNALCYFPLGHDFGPFDLTTTCRYIYALDALNAKQIIHVIPPDLTEEFKANSAVLMCAYAIFRLGASDAVALASVFDCLEFAGFVDALGSPFRLSIRDVCEGFLLARSHSWFDLSSFDVAEAEALQSCPGGDLNWIMPGKFCAFAGPSEDDKDTLHPKFYLEIFTRLRVSNIIRLNKARYSKKHFTASGFSHHDLLFRDGSCPPPPIIRKFLNIADQADDAIAIHCKAGLGRTVTLISLWMMRKFRLKARPVIGWCRVARPGSVLGHQQDFLLEMEDRITDSSLYGRKDKRCMNGQGSLLCTAKKRARNEENECSFN